MRRLCLNHTVDLNDIDPAKRAVKNFTALYFFIAFLNQSHNQGSGTIIFKSLDSFSRSRASLLTLYSNR